MYAKDKSYAGDQQMPVADATHCDCRHKHEVFASIRVIRGPLRSQVEQLVVRLGAFAVVTLFACTPLRAQDVPRWKFSPGDELRYEVTQATAMGVDAGEAGDFSTDATQTLDVVWQIDEVDDAGIASGAQKIERIRLSVSMPSGLELTYDSQSGEAASGIAAMLTPMFETLLEGEVPIKVAPDGEVLECEVPGPMAERLARVPATRAMSYLVTAAGVRQVAEQIALPLPEDGEPARRELVVQNRVLGTLQADLAWTQAEGDTSDIARFTPGGTLSIEPAKPVDIEESSDPQPLESPTITTQAIEGAAEFDTSVGRLKSSKLALDFTITGQLMGNTVVSNVKQTVEVTEQ
jgi:hypothetical protein